MSSTSNEDKLIDLIECRVIELEKALYDRRGLPESGHLADDVRSKQEMLQINYRWLERLYREQAHRHPAPRVVQ